MTQSIKAAIESGQTYLGIELGSTRIKATLIDGGHNPIASGSHGWENKLEKGVWTYSLEDVWTGLRSCYARLAADVEKKYGVKLQRVGAMGVSAMMHGYMAFDKEGDLLAPFRTWRNTVTGQAAEALTRLFEFNIPQRWSIAHLYQAILAGEGHVPQIGYLTTLSGYIHWKLTGERVLGVGDASGMFPIDSALNQYDARMVRIFDSLIKEQGYEWKLGDILPKVCSAGQWAGVLTAQGASLLDPAGALKPGIAFCPPEGDAGTGMVATNSVATGKGNVSAGTSIFAMTVLEKPLLSYYTQIDMVTTPSGEPVAMVHCNNCTSDLDAYIRLFGEAACALGAQTDADTLYSTLYQKALEGDADCGGLLVYNYLAGEPITELDQGRPLLVRLPGAGFTLANLMRAHVYGALGSLKLGMDILLSREKVELKEVTGHGGFFKTPVVGQRLMAAALNAAVTVVDTAGEGGPWGMAILAAYRANKAPNQTLGAYLKDQVFKNSASVTLVPEPADVEGFGAFMELYKKGLAVERAAVEALN